MIQFLAPLITHSSPSRTAVVRIAAGSEPASGSDIAKAGDHSPLAQRGSRRSRSSSEPKRWIGSVPSSWTMRMSALDAHACAISSTATWSMSEPVPGAAVLDRERQREDVVLGEQPPDVPRVLAAAVDLGRARAHALFDDLADRVAELPVLGGEVGEIRRRRRHGAMVVARACLPIRTGSPSAMAIGTSLFLIAVGAILRLRRLGLARGDRPADRRPHPLVVGIVGLLISLFFLSQARRAPAERTVVRDRDVY